jgi:putative copper export protein
MVAAPSSVVLAGADTVRGQVAPPVSHAIVESAPETTTITTAVRWAELVALLTLVGTLIFSVFVVPGAKLPTTVALDARDRARRLAGSVLLLFVVTTLWRLSAQADLLPSAPSSQVAAMLTVARDTGWGAGWLVGAAGALIAAVGLIFARRTPLGWFVAGTGVVAMAVSEGLTGHAAASKQVALAAAVDVSHVLGGGGWLGGLVAVTLCGLAATRRGETAGQAVLSHQLIRSYHRSAVECVTIVLVTGVAGIGLAWFRLGQPTVFWTSTYGRVLLLKIGFALVLLAFGWFHWRTVVVRDWTEDTSFRFKRSVAFELLVGAGIVGVTAVLLSTGLTSH